MSQRPTLDERGLPAGYPFKPQYELTPRDVKDAMARAPGSLLLIDCRTPEEWAVAHVEGSIHIPLDAIEKRLDEIELAEGATLAVICHHGVRSMRAALMLRAHGFKDAMSVAGGIDAWSLGADASVPRYDRANGSCRVVP
jgi:rhodanese-related sulfurtransferase